MIFSQEVTLDVSHLKMKITDFFFHSFRKEEEYLVCTKRINNSKSSTLVLGIRDYVSIGDASLSTINNITCNMQFYRHLSFDAFN